MSDIFRPSREPAKSIYDAFRKESELRGSRSVDEWQEAERLAVYHAAEIQALRAGLKMPTMKEIHDAEQSAMGHVDYGAKWAYGVVDKMNQN